MKGRVVLLIVAVVIIVGILMTGPVLSTLSPTTLTARLSVLAGDSLLYFDQPDAALEWYVKAYQSDPDVGTVEKISNLALSTKKYSLGEDILRSCSISNPDDPRVLAAEGNFLVGKGSYLEARDVFKNMTRAAPQDSSAWLRYGDAALMLSIFKQEEMKTLSNRTASHDQATLSRIATASLEASEFYREAVGAYQEAIRLDPKNSLYVSTRIIPHAQGMASDFGEIMQNPGT